MRDLPSKLRLAISIGSCMIITLVLSVMTSLNGMACEGYIGITALIASLFIGLVVFQIADMKHTLYGLIGAFFTGLIVINSGYMCFRSGIESMMRADLITIASVPLDAIGQFGVLDILMILSAVFISYRINA